MVVVVVVVVEEEVGAVVSCEITDAMQKQNQITEKLHCDHILWSLMSDQNYFFNIFLTRSGDFTAFSWSSLPLYQHSLKIHQFKLIDFHFVNFR